MVNYLSWIHQEKGGGKDIDWSAQNAALFVDLFIKYLLFALFPSVSRELSSKSIFKIILPSVVLISYS